MSSSGGRCPLCGGETTEVLFSGVARCLGCGLVRTLGPPAPYAPSYFSIGWFKRFLPGVGRSRLRACADRAPGRLLDYGSGEGDFVGTARAAGWDALGCDPFAPRADFRSTDEARRAGFRPDLVTFWHSLEHVDDPVSVLRDLAGLLAPGGAIFVTVPDFDSAQSCWGGPAWFHLDVPRHRFHYTRSTLAAVADRAGLSCEDRSGPRMEYDPAGWIQTILNRIVPEPNALYRTLKCDRAARGWGVLSATLLPALVPAAILLTAYHRATPATCEAILTPPQPSGPPAPRRPPPDPRVRTPRGG